MKRAPLLLVMVCCCTALGGCYVHAGVHAHHRGRYQEAPPPEAQPAQPVAQPAQPVAQPAQPVTEESPRTAQPIDRSVRRPVPPPMAVEAQPTTARRGYEVTVYLRPFPQQDVQIYLNGQSLVRRVAPSGDSYIVLIPATAGSGALEVEWNGQRYRSAHITVTP